MKLQVFLKIRPSEHINITVFGITLFELWFTYILDEYTVAFTVLGIKLQLTWHKKK